MSPVESFKKAFLANDIPEATKSFSLTGELHSPFYSSPFVGRGPVGQLLQHVRSSLDDLTFTDDIESGPTRIFVFKATVDSESVHGVDLLRLDDKGLIASFTVFIRPKRAARALEAAVRAQLGAVEAADTSAPTVTGLKGNETTGLDPELRSTTNPLLRKTMRVAGNDMAYIDVGVGKPVVFLHGNPTSSHLWRNIIPHVESSARCLAPDLLGMGYSDKRSDLSYRFHDHSSALDEWFDQLGLDSNITLVLHDWGSALGFDWACRHPDAVDGIVYMESLVQPMTWDDWPDAARDIFQQLRSENGEEMILSNNLFVEALLPMSSLAGIADADLAIYREPYLQEGTDRLPTLMWSREVPMEGSPADVVAVIERYGKWLETATVPKLFIDAEPGMIMGARQKAYCRSWPNQSETLVTASHYVQEDAAEAVGEAVAEFVRQRTGANT